MTRGAAAVVLLCTGAALANPELTVDLPGRTPMVFVWIEAGVFAMGAPDADDLAGDDERPQHLVTIDQGFWLAKYELTQLQWRAAMGTEPWAGHVVRITEGWDYPAVRLSLEDVQGYLAKANGAEGRDVYRLPTEAEWEYACRAGTTTRWSFGDDQGDLASYAHMSVGGASLTPVRVGTKLPNAWGLHDMHGNAAEWVQDWAGAYPGAPETDPQGPASGSWRLVRGGWCNGPVRLTRSTARFLRSPQWLDFSTGVRLVRMGPAPTTVAPQTWGQIRTGGR